MTRLITKKRNPKKTSILETRSHAGVSVELFSGCGGLATGLSKAGFEHRLLVEWDADAHATVAHNKARGIAHVRDWPFLCGDVCTVDWSQFRDSIDIVAGGPPCQPFSIGGKAAGNNDQRDMWPEAIRAVRETSPKAFFFENVRGLLRPAFATYVEWVRSYLANPNLIIKDGETYLAHLDRLRKQKLALYDVQVVAVNAANYGAAQKRHRVIIVGIRRDLGVSLQFPTPTHSQERLVWDKWVSGEYWERHGMNRPRDQYIPLQEARIVAKIENNLIPPIGAAWMTCRDAFLGLGVPSSGSIANHIFQPGARAYAGHTGSPIDEPAKALKAGVHGVPGGENMVALKGGKVRYFSVREAARLQGLSDDYEFPRSWTESMRQLGNAVPVPLAEGIGAWIASLINLRDNQTKVA